jgi:hypothetical protein
LFLRALLLLFVIQKAIMEQVQEKQRLKQLEKEKKMREDHRGIR